MRIEAWPLTEPEIAEVMRALRFQYFKWDLNACGKRLVIPHSLVLTQAEHEHVVSVCERFGRILERLETELLQRPDLLDNLGIPLDVLPFLRATQPTALQLARYDVFLTPDGRWMVSEFNEDVPGGFNEADGVPALLGPHVRGARFPGDLRRRILEAFQAFEHVAFLFATGYSEDLQHMLIIRQWLESAGHTTVLASPVHLRCRWRGPRVFHRRCDAAFRFYPGEWFHWLGNRRHWERALPMLPLMNPLRRLIRQSKRLYTVWNDATLLDPGDREFLAAHTPASFPFEQVVADPSPATRTGSSSDRGGTLAGEPDFLETGNRTRWVLKHAFGRMGDAVVMGNLAGDTQWQDALDEARRTPREWLLQERFEVASLPAAEAPLFPALGVYLVNHTFAGYYSRAAHHPFINHEAYHVATLVEAS